MMYGNMEASTPGLLQGNENILRGTLVAKKSIAFGQVVCGFLGDEKNCYPYAKDVAEIVFDADFVTSNTITLTLNGGVVASTPYLIDHATTMQNLIIALATKEIEAKLDAEDASGRTLLLRDKGVGLTVAVVVTGGASQAGSVVTTGAGGVFLGLASRTQNSAGMYEVQDPVNILVEGIITAPCSTLSTAHQVATVGIDGNLSMQSSDELLPVYFRENKSAAGLVDATVFNRYTAFKFTDKF